MFTITDQLAGVESSVTRVITSNVARDLIANLDIGDDVTLLHAGDNSEEHVPNTLKNKGQLKSKEVVTISSNTNYLDTSLGGMDQRLGSHALLMYDAVTKFAVSPVYARMRNKMELTWHFDSKSKAERFVHHLRMRAERHLRGLSHAVSYHYIIPDFTLLVAYEMYQKTEEALNEGTTWQEWYDKHRDPMLTIMSNLNNSQSEIARREQQGRILGNFQPPEKEHLVGRSTVTLAYTFDFNLPVHLVVQYPWLVCNRPIQEELRPKVTTNDPYFAPERYSHITGGLGFNETKPAYPYGLPVPRFTRWQAESLAHGTKPAYHVHNVVDPTQPNALFKLTDVQEIDLNPRLLTYMKNNHAYLDEQFESAVSVTLYVDGKIQIGSLNIDGDLNITSKEPMDVRKTYVVLVSWLTDLQLLSSRAKVALQEDPLAFATVVCGVSPESLYAFSSDDDVLVYSLEGGLNTSPDDHSETISTEGNIRTTITETRLEDSTVESVVVKVAIDTGETLETTKNIIVPVTVPKSLMGSDLTNPTISDKGVGDVLHEVAVRSVGIQRKSNNFELLVGRYTLSANRGF